MVEVAVIDTGVDLDHPDLNVISGTDCVFPGTTAEDDNGHGTHVAGTIAAKNTGSGVVGVVPGTTIVAVKALYGNQSTPLSVVICGIDWVTANAAALNIKVVNMSLGGVGTASGTCGATADPFRIAICGSIAAGVTYVVAAGNETQNIASHVPAAYPEVLTVTSMSDSDGLPGGTGGSISCPNSPTLNADDSASNFSNYATTAPGGRPHGGGAGQVHPVDVAGQWVRDDLRNEHGDAPRRGCGRALPWQRGQPRAVRRTGAGAGDGAHPRRRRRGAGRVRLHGCRRPALRQSRSRRRVQLGGPLRYAAAPSVT